LSERDRAEIKWASNAADGASLILLGFKSATAIPFAHMLGNAYFVYPNDEAVQGSVMAFGHLHASMLRKGVVAIGELLTRSTSTSRLVALSPIRQRRSIDEDGDVVLKGPPDGMVVVSLPFEDDVKALNYGTGPNDKPVMTEDLVGAAAALVEKLTLKNVVLGENFPNMHVKRYWELVEKKALGPYPGDAGKEEDIFDDTKYDEAVIEKVAGKEIKALADLLPDDVEIMKEAKKRELLPDPTGHDWGSDLREGSLDEHKLEDLKHYLRSRGLRIGGKKAELVARVKNHLVEELLAQQNKKIKVEAKTVRGENDTDVDARTVTDEDGHNGGGLPKVKIEDGDMQRI